MNSAEIPADSKRDLPICVIGAGPCGLAVAKTLAEFGLAFECLEARDRVGGLWDVEGGASGAYRSLSTNTSTRAMAYSDFPFAADYAIQPSAAEMLRYFDQYADQAGIRDQIQLQVAVEEATRSPDGSWRVRLSDGGVRNYSALIVATGQYARPRWPSPDKPGHFSGERLHSFDYLDPQTPVDCRGKRVIVVGLGSTAAEIAAELVDTAAEVTISARSGRYILPKMIDGRPLDGRAPHPAAPLHWLLRAIPEAPRLWLFRRVLRMVFRRLEQQIGTPESLGLPPHELEAWDDRPTMSLDFVPALRARKIAVKPDIRAFEGNSVEFVDDSKLDADVILYATGYHMDFPYLSEQTLGSSAPELSLYQRVVHPSHENLFFVGCCRVLCSIWPLAEQQARWISRHLRGEFALPPETERIQRAVSLTKAKPVICNFYIDALRQDAGGVL